MRNLEPGPGLHKKDFNPDELFAVLSAKLDSFVNEYSKRLKVGVQKEFERRLAEVRSQLDQASKKAVEQYNKEIEKLNKYKNIPELFGPASESVRNTLEITLETHQQLMDQFIANCKDLIS